MKYSDLTILAPSEDIMHVFGKVFSAVHSWNSQDNRPGRIALDFPEAKTNRGMGRVIRFFADTPDVIRAFFQDSRFMRMLVNARMVEPSDISEVPVTVAFRAVIRDNSVSKMTPSRQRRIMARNPDAIIKERTNTSERTPFYIITDSSSNGQRFSIFLKFQEITSGTLSTQDISSYGLSSTHSPVALPVF